jgi:hypothetical protein
LTNSFGDFNTWSVSLIVFEVVARQYMRSESVWWSKAAYLLARKYERDQKKKTKPGSHNLLGGHASVTRKPPLWSHLPIVGD